MTINDFTAYMISHASANRLMHTKAETNSMRLFYGMVAERLEGSGRSLEEYLSTYPQLKFSEFIVQAYTQLVVDHCKNLFNHLAGIGDLNQNDLLVDEQVLSYWTSFMASSTDKQTFPLPHLMLRK